MPCELKEAGAIYRPRQPQQTPFYQLVERFYPEFEALYQDTTSDPGSTPASASTRACASRPRTRKGFDA